MIRSLLFVSLVLTCRFSIADDVSKAAPAESAGMHSLFNGEDLTAWDGDPNFWSVRDGVIHGETTKENPARGNTFLIYRGGELANFELRLSFRCNATNNSGIQYRSSMRTSGRTDGKESPNKWKVKGYQHEIRNQNQLPNVSGFIYDEGGKRGRICLIGEKATWEADGKKLVSDELIDKAGFEKLMKLDDWNDVIIIAKRNHIQHFLNGQLVLDFTDNHPEMALKQGLLALQLHAGAPMWTEFKNIRVRSID